MTTAQIFIDKASFSYDKLYDYIVPHTLKLSAGMRVVVPFGKTAQRLGFVMSVTENTTTDQKCKEIINIVDSQPILNPEGIMLLRWLKDNTFCTWFDGLRTLIPTGLGQRIDVGLVAVDGDISSLTQREVDVYKLVQSKKKPLDMGKILEKFPDGSLLVGNLLNKNLLEEKKHVVRKVQDQTVAMVRLTSDYMTKTITTKQQLVVEALEETGECSVKEVCYYTGVGKTVVDNLIKSKVLECFAEEVYRDPFAEADRSTTTEEVVLNEEQTVAYETLWECYKKASGSTALLFGVTGSGKTQVFLKTTQRVISDGKTAIIMVPEIALTPQTIGKFHQYFGDRVAVLHSSLSISERLDEWKRIQRGLVDVVIGTRSAVFAPISNLGLIVIDEEQEHTYRSESTPRYDTRDVAKIRCKYGGGMTILASATPSVDSYYHAEKGDYTLVTLTQRYGNARLPDICIIDLATQVGVTNISHHLGEQLLYNLEQKEQSIILMNRRGYSSQIKCLSCHQPATCPNCSISLKYHNANNRLMCHYCGYSADLHQKCTMCGSDLIQHVGTGTQKLEEELKFRFPNARILRMDLDTTMRKNSHQKHLEAFANGDYDIMIGTQMVAKGLNFPNVTLVGVVGIDQSLYSEDFRSFEKTFSLITQVVGRSGRSEKIGRAYIETYTPENPIITLSATQQYLSFYKDEIINRKNMLYPPFCRIFCIGITGENDKQTFQVAKQIQTAALSLLKESYSDIPVRYLGISQASIHRVANKFRYKILIKGNFNKRSKEFYHRLLAEGVKLGGRDVHVYINPQYDNQL